MAILDGWSCGHSASPELSRGNGRVRRGRELGAGEKVRGMVGKLRPSKARLAGNPSFADNVGRLAECGPRSME